MSSRGGKPTGPELLASPGSSGRTRDPPRSPPCLGCDATSTEARVGPVSGGTRGTTEITLRPGTPSGAFAWARKIRSPSETAPESTMANKGILGRKLGMTQVFDEGNRIVPVTVIEAGPCRVVQIKTPERDGYAAVQLAFGATLAQRLNEAGARPFEGGQQRPGPVPRRTAGRRSLRASSSARFLKADVFSAGGHVDVTGISKGKGFAGVMKRHNFSGQGTSHGNHKKRHARLDRRVRHSGPCVQGHEDGRPDGQRAHPPR